MKITQLFMQVVDILLNKSGTKYGVEIMEGVFNVEVESF